MMETYYSDMMHGMLSSKAVSQFCEDKKGNMWIATEDGGVNYLNVNIKQITQLEDYTGSFQSLSLKFLFHACNKQRG
ncbi:MAG: hypothetical protein LUH22_04500 [Bacteroides sp.]|nr:hypothetical protein [Bacteroides sp.]